MRDLTSQELESLYEAVYGESAEDSEEIDTHLAPFVALTAEPVEHYKVKAETLYREFQVAPGLRRGDLFIRDFGDFRAVYFDGEGIR